MSQRGDSTRDWLLKKLLKAKESLVEQGQEIRRLVSDVAKARKDADDWQARTQERELVLERLAERVDDQEFELQQLKRVPPIAPNLDVIYHTQRGLQYSCQVDAVQSANGHTTIHVRWPGSPNRRVRDAEAIEFIG